MNVNISSQQLGAWGLRLAAIAGIITTINNTFGLPANIRAVMAAAASLLLIVDRFVTDPTTGTGPTPPNGTNGTKSSSTFKP